MVPADAELTARPEEIPAWDEMPDNLKPVLARQMEVYAGFLAHTDHHIGRLIDALADMEVLDDTLVYVIIGDNGASAEGTLNGTFNELMSLNGAAALETPEFMAARIDKFGTPEAYNHYAVGWAHAMDTPYQWTKQVASHWGGTRNGTIVHWPKGIEAKGELRHQFHHVIDFAPTVLEAVGLPEPGSVHGVQQRPYEGVSMVYSFDDAESDDRHTTQYFEMFVNRGIYHQGWTAVTRHSTPWDMNAPLPALDDDKWELYAPDDWTQADDISAENPQKLAELQRLFMLEASKYHVFPLDDRRVERFNSDLAGRPTLIRGDSQLLFGGMGRLTENVVLNIKNKSHAVTADVTVPEGGGSGVIIAQGGAFGGWSIYLHEGRPAYCYNLFGLQQFKVHGESQVPAGDHQVRMEFSYDGGGLGKGGVADLYVDGSKVGTGRVEATVPMLFSGDETTDIGSDSATPVSDEYDREEQHVHRSRPPGPARPRCGRRGRRPPDQPGGADAHRDVEAVTIRTARLAQSAPAICATYRRRTRALQTLEENGSVTQSPRGRSVPRPRPGSFRDGVSARAGTLPSGPACRRSVSATNRMSRAPWRLRPVSPRAARPRR